jgi:Flp pilus assembly protein TadG
VTAQRFFRDKKGAAAIEFAFTAPVFFAFVGGLIQVGLLLYTQIALQHGVESAARCASVNTTTCGSTSQIQSYAAAQSYGISVPASAFTVSAASCGTQVQASSSFGFIFSYFGTPSLTLTASSCFPK